MPDDVDALQTRPGQYIQRIEGGPGELKQALRWVWALFLSRALTVLSIAWTAFVLGPTRSGLAALLVLSLLLMKAMRDSEGQALEDRLPPNVAATLWLLLALAAAAWVFYGGSVLETVWPLPLGWKPYRLRWYWQLALLSPSAVWWTVQSSIDWRLNNEITDPNWPAPINPRLAYYGPARPYSDYDAPPPGVEQPPPEPRGSVPRPVRYGEGAALKLPKSEIEDALSGALATKGGNSDSVMKPLEAVHVASPSGGTVRFSDLVSFARQSPNIGATYSSWSDRWDHEYWGNVVDIAAVFGIVTEREPKTKTQVLITNWSRSVRLLSQMLEGYE